MANPEHLKILEQGVEVWNRWREENPQVSPNLEEAYFKDHDFKNYNLKKANLKRIHLIKVNFSEANLTDANLYLSKIFGCEFYKATLCKTTLTAAMVNEFDDILTSFKNATITCCEMQGSNFNKIDFTSAVIKDTNFSGTLLIDIDFNNTQLINVKFENTNISGSDFTNSKVKDCKIFGIAAWNLKNLNKAKQSALIITPTDEPVITVDDIAVGQFIHMISNNKNITKILKESKEKLVLILGRFADGHDKILNSIGESLKSQNLIPIVFNFDKPDEMNFTEGDIILASMSKFVIADLTNPKSLAQELQAIIPYLPSIPIQPILNKNIVDIDWIIDPDGKIDPDIWSMFIDFFRYPRVMNLKLYEYDGNIKELDMEEIIKKVNEMKKEMKSKLSEAEKDLEDIRKSRDNKGKY